MKILVLNGPNINMLGIREPHIYGKNTYQDLENLVSGYADKKGVVVEFIQSNHEGDLVDAIQRAYFDKTDGIIINPAAYTHTSIAILDALKATGIPTVEVHISDISAREEFRKVSFIRDYVLDSVIGKGLDGYNIAMDIILEHFALKGQKNEG
ncbi:MAG: type II 3-dehydroquinate dehydratase [Clostridia bacterium]|nr:type II 3-dehydroquinate dehydratase [Clostridia bacterium]